jgi:cytochrome c oxidase subunit IV
LALVFSLPRMVESVKPEAGEVVVAVFVFMVWYRLGLGLVVIVCPSCGRRCEPRRIAAGWQ